MPRKPQEAPLTKMFQIGRHVLQVFGGGRKWVVAVDGVLLRGWHSSSADAWSAGVTVVDRVQRSSAPATREAAPAAGTLA
jgi:hypothetical protein